MVAIGVAKDHQIHLLDLLAPQQGCQYAFTHIKEGVVAEAAAVYQYRITIRQLQQVGTALPHIYGSDTQILTTKTVVIPIGCVQRP